MPIIKPISDLRNKSLEISRLAHKSREPIFITRNGEGDLVVMSMESYDRLRWRQDLFDKLAEAEADIAAGDKGRLMADVMRDIRKGIRERKRNSRAIG